MSKFSGRGPWRAMNQGTRPLFDTGPGGNYVRKLRAVLPYLPYSSLVLCEHQEECGIFEGRLCDCDPTFIDLTPANVPR